MRPLRFDNRFVRELPADPSTEPGRRQVHGALYSRVQPTPVAAPRLVAWSRECARLLGLAAEDVEAPLFAQAMAGNAILDGMQPYAANYGGHQFGHWAGQLGDGRAITLGEAVDAAGARHELQLKGAGPTPYSRSADGRAVLRSSVREFLVSEAMHHLGVPTTRALCLVATGEDVVRDMFYDGRPRAEPGAIVCRVAPSFLRFGNFELPASRGDVPLLERLVEFTVRRDFPHLVEEGRPVDAGVRARWFAEVCERTAVMVAHWMRVGFVHGVMNTDNMSILGLTIDYGPYGWIDDFDLDWTPNTTDAEGRRYRFGHQAQIAYWNLTRLASALVPLFETHDPLHEGLARYEAAYVTSYREHAAAKLGIAACTDEDVDLLHALYGLMQAAEMDMTITFRALSSVAVDAPSVTALAEAFYDEGKRAAHEPALGEWLARYAARVRADGVAPEARCARMRRANPRYVLRNYLAQEAIDRAEQGDYSGIDELLDVLREPYAEQPGRERYAAKRPDWARDRAGCSMLSCSS
jgi:protein adenylyltransferase